MPDWLSIHEPVLVNTIGHSAGAVIFGMLLYFFLVNRRRAGEGRGRLPVMAAVLAMLWNIGSLIALAAGPSGGRITGAIVAVSFSILSLLPAVLLHISLESRRRAVWIGGYFLSGIAVALHLGDWLSHAPGLHYDALLVVTLGFAALTILSVILEWRQANRAAGSRLAGSMALFLLAISFAHFGPAHTQMAWSKEAALHHAGLPLALLVLLQDYRFLLMDAFLRFIVNATLAAAALLAAIRVLESRLLADHLARPFDAGIIFVSAGLLLTLFVWLHNRIQHFVTTAIFLRANVDEAMRELQDLALAARAEPEYLRCAAEAIARFLHASHFEFAGEDPARDRSLTSPVAVLDSGHWAVPAWVQAVLPMRFSRGDAAYLLLGPRQGGRRYLSEDIGVLARLGAAVAEHIEQLRNAQMQSLVTQAELKALQAQINPHFLFNSLNTLYGTIDRANTGARRLVLNLADVYRYLLRSERSLVSVEEELRIVRAYLEIEELRLGDKLRTAVDADPSTLPVTIPLLSIQPLVENAVKHGVAARVGGGFVQIRIRPSGEGVSVEVSNSGECDPEKLSRSSSGIGLANVRRRLALCYGAEARFEIRASGGVTTVAFLLPNKLAPELAAAVS
ncbi:MAG TPA: histidine kinase [Bryobacteraceae bacterium]|nr:histidine kinase [Bryobacteraceae bacterium]